MKLSFVAAALAFAAVASAIPAPLDARANDKCIDAKRATNRFTLASMKDAEEGVCKQFLYKCNQLVDGSNKKVNSSCVPDEQKVIKASCIVSHQRGERLSYTRNIAKDLKLGLVVNAKDGCDEFLAGKCSKLDFNGEPRVICRKK